MEGAQYKDNNTLETAQMLYLYLLNSYAQNQG